MHTNIKPILIAAMIMGVGVVGFVGWLASGSYDIGADTHHGQSAAGLIGYARNRSIAVHARDIKGPALDDAALIAAGAEHYSAMCTGCHLAPGVESGELRAGLYPVPPELAKEQPRSPAETFWIIKHGIKMTAMPAWGITHDDDAIWSLVAFVKRLPTLTATEYRTLVGAASDDHAALAPENQARPAQKMDKPPHRHHHHDRDHDHY